MDDENVNIFIYNGEDKEAIKSSLGVQKSDDKGTDKHKDESNDGDDDDDDDEIHAVAKVDHDVVQVAEGVSAIQPGVFEEWNSLICVQVQKKLSTGTSTRTTLIEIGDRAFYNCSALEYVEWLRQPTNQQQISVLPKKETSTGQQEQEQNYNKQLPTIPIQVIGKKAFSGCSSLQTIQLPTSLWQLKEGAFSRCIQLERVEFLSHNTKLQRIESTTFADCPLLKQIIPCVPSSVTIIEEGAFQNCSSLQAIEWINKSSSSSSMSLSSSPSLERIESRAFFACTSLRHLTIPPSVQVIGKRAFSHCSSLESITFFTAPSSTTTATLSSLREIGKQAFRGCKSLRKHIHLPMSISKLDDGVFEDCSGLESISFVTPLTTTTNMAKTDVTTDDTPMMLRVIGKVAFRRCSSLHTIQFSKNGNDDDIIGMDDNSCCSCTIEKLDAGAFQNCISLSTIDLPTSIREISSHVFLGCSSLRRVRFPKKGSILHTIGEAAFQKCTDLEGIELPNSLKQLGPLAFSHCSSLKDIIVPLSMSKINESTFQHCSALTSVTFSHPSSGSYSLKEIGPYSFADCSSLRKIDLPDTLERIGRAAFEGCIRLESITFPTSLHSMGKSAFNGCARLRRVQFSTEYHHHHHVRTLTTTTTPTTRTTTTRSGTISRLEKINDATFQSCPRLEVVELANSIKEIGNYAFSGCSNLRRIQLSNSLERIGISSFQHCVMMESIELPRTLHQIGKHAFSGCFSLRRIEIPNGIRELNESSFQSCATLEAVTFNTTKDSTLQIIHRHAFLSCSSLKHITLPDSVQELKKGCFQNCIALESVSLSSSSSSSSPSSPTSSSSSRTYSSLREIGDHAFHGCSSLRHIDDFPDTLQTIQEFAFQYCSSLESIAILSNEAMADGTYDGDDDDKNKNISSNKKNKNSIGFSIGRHAFSGCTNLKIVHLPKNINTIPSSSSSMMKVISESTFCNCNTLETIYLPNSIKEIGINAFAGCSSLKYIHCHDGQQEQLEQEQQKQILLPTSLYQISTGAFFECSSLPLSSLVIPFSVQEVEIGAFGGINDVDNGTSNTTTTTTTTIDAGTCTEADVDVDDKEHVDASFLCNDPRSMEFFLDVNRGGRSHFFRPRYDLSHHHDDEKPDDDNNTDDDNNNSNDKSDKKGIDDNDDILVVKKIQQRQEISSSNAFPQPALWHLIFYRILNTMPLFHPNKNNENQLEQQQEEEREEENEEGAIRGDNANNDDDDGTGEKEQIEEKIAIKKLPLLPYKNDDNGRRRVSVVYYFLKTGAIF